VRQLDEVMTELERVVENADEKSGEGMGLGDCAHWGRTMRITSGRLFTFGDCRDHGTRRRA